MNIMNTKSPCKDCKDRAIPKTCEMSCELWKEYRCALQEEKMRIVFAKELKKSIKKQEWRDRRNEY